MKPFAFVELLARLKAILRRPNTRVEPLRVGEIEVDPLHHQAWFRDERLDLTAKEFELLRCLIDHRGEVMTRAQLLEAVWGYRFDPGTNVVDVRVARLRAKLERVGAKEVRTRRGLGATCSRSCHRSPSATSRSTTSRRP